MASDAKKHGLIDKIGSMDDAMKSIRNLVDNKNKTRMSNAIRFAAVCALLGFENGIESTSEGIHLQEAHLEKINTVLSTHNQLQADHTALEATANTNAGKVTDLTQQVTALTNDRDAWKTKAEKLGKESSGTGTSIVSEKDDTTNTSPVATVPSYLDPKNPFNQVADTRRKR